MKKSIIALILIPLLFLTVLPASGTAAKEERIWQDESIYYLLIDRYSNRDNSNDYDVDVRNPERFHGGDFKGIIDRLDHIEDLGFTTIALSPVFANGKDGYHGYWVEDFYETEEQFGSIDEFKKLVKEAHERDIKVMIDFPINHVGTSHPWVNDPDKAEWFIDKEPIETEDNMNKDWLNGLPALNQDHPEVKEYLIDAANWWIDETNIDGYRIEGVQLASQNFVTEFVSAVKATKKDFYVLGDVWSNDPNEIAQFESTGIDSFADYPSVAAMRDSFKEPDVAMTEALADLETNLDTYKNPYMMARFLDNQDMVRFTRDMIELNQHPGPRWRNALTYLFTVPGIPIVYYASEIAVDGGETPDNRKQMDFRTDKELIEYLGQLSSVREQLPSLTRGTIEVLHEEDGFTVFKREYEEETSVVVINNTSGTKDIILTADQLEANKELRGLLAGDLVKSNPDEEYHIVLDREEAEIYVLTDKAGFNLTYGITLLAVLFAFFLFLFLAKRRGMKNNKD
ncbi:glycosidase [Cytobacillus horneckiae]|uniref:alpha-amylase family glycosyl hydrolase n=1 Tax=Cytobacillus horneckiae TaxID=549687 RepID=UPI0019D13BAB|nr:alpha-amylase family glycosyl hydrolase [Cytobacillus horneckiae]MBN6887583.1 alpha-amylase [Cytobacillus horneckiae]MCM3178642.1 alpha-amylase family glycosyl hydrolase [Cytobacillus horneckiae]